MNDKFSVEELKEMTREVNSCNNNLYYLDYWPNDEYFFETFYSNRIDEAVRAVCYGDYEYMDDYVRINDYGNLDSCSEYEYEKELENYADEIVDAYYENINDMWDEELNKKVKEIKEKENE